MYLKTGDNVVITTGKDKGKEGLITKVLRNKNKVIVENLNMVTKHIKPQSGVEGQRITKEAAIDASNVMLIDPTTKKPTRVGFKIEDGKKVRIAKKSGKEI
ncbi:MAG: 50S ribosomal protein L24 [Mycoplasmatales bacterium]